MGFIAGWKLPKNIFMHSADRRMLWEVEPLCISPLRVSGKNSGVRMNSALTGFLTVFGAFHVLLATVPVVDTLKAPISVKSKIFWCLFLILLPFIGVAVFHFRYRKSLFQGKAYEISAAEERARSGTLAPRDHDQ